ncbi:uncharacterized protein LOC126672643 [Mercurialis annua]|uniref:uncharacterized protein LOC126672643 n=1 Tax=Mercurialis annua TaxID=3986 RepID=UPI002160F03A|nr:uncharacterized protein LOC126672643 [Mercurialis annua]
MLKFVIYGKNGEWSLPDPMDDVTQNAWEQVSKFKIVPDREDRVNWKIEKNKAFSIRSLYYGMAPNPIKVVWYKLVWYKGYIPRYSFIVWLCMKKRLLTKDKLVKWKVIDSDLCSLCGRGKETHFSCNFSQGIWRKALRDLGFDKPTYPLNREVDFFLRRTSGRSSDSKARKVMLAATINFILRSKNEVIFNQNSLSEEQVWG